MPSKSYVDRLDESSRNRRHLASVFNDQHNEFDNKKLTNLDSVSVIRDPSSDNEPANTKDVAETLGSGNILRFIQTLQNYLKVFVGNDIYSLTKYDRKQNTETTNVKYPNTGGYLLQKWVIKCNDRINNNKKQNLVKSTKTNSPTGYSGATSLPPIGDSFMYTETSSNNRGNNVFLVSNQPILYKFLIQHSIITDIKF